MTETVVHVTTLEQWKSVLDVWFKQGYEWVTGGKKYKEEYFTEEYTRYLNLFGTDISKTSIRLPSEFIEYSEFMEQQKGDKKMAMVYEVSQSVFDELQMIKAHEGTSLIGAITWNAQFIKSIEVGNKAILRYLADDPAIEFKVKEPLYRLWRADGDDRIYMRLNDFGTPIWTAHKDNTFTAPLEEIKKWKTPAWDVEKAD
ncbi:hypothetical protein QUE93_07255 [Leuconostoc falkenbergense]|uniref:DUF1642 domain-containing protein n=1 Tax=Leuconostoc falkenbergense TaxID=2766470 RepID=A0ABT7RZT7_9LACO|nr:hypothetical protein [Leuconostoc falkenbergense]MDM7646811.1 hypothetical protein [Leuconostoc falkenbergense]